MGLLDKDTIIKAEDLAYEDVEVPEWGGTVRLRMLTGTDRDAYEASIFKGGKNDFTNLRSKLLARCIVDEKGKRMFKDHELDVLGAKSSKVLNLLFEKAQALNGMTAEAKEEIEKNSESGAGGDSTSISPES